MQNDVKTQLFTLSKERAKLEQGHKVASQVLKNIELKIYDIDNQIKDIINLDDSANFIEEKSVIDDANFAQLAPKTKINLIRVLDDEDFLLLLDLAKDEEDEKQVTDNKLIDDKEKEKNKKAQLTAEQIQQQCNPDKVKDLFLKVFQQRDPRKLQKGINILAKKKNRPLLKQYLKDPVFKKAFKEAKKKVSKYEKIKASMRNNLKKLMQTNSTVAIGCIDALKEGKITAGVKGLREMGSKDNHNELARAATGIVSGVDALTKEFGLKPTDTLTKNFLEESKPILTRQTFEKTDSEKQMDAMDANNSLNKNKFAMNASEEDKKDKLVPSLIAEILSPEKDKNKKLSTVLLDSKKNSR